MKTALIAGAAIAGAALLYILVKRKAGEPLASTAGRELVGAAAGVATGAVTGLGSLVGIPQTSVSQCESDRAAGRTWAASFSCPASDFVGYVFNSTAANESTMSRDELRRFEIRQQSAPEPLTDYEAALAQHYASNTGA